MIVERMPDFLSSYGYYIGSYSVEFDKNGRFVYIKRDTGKIIPNFLIYDIMFNSFMQVKLHLMLYRFFCSELTADASVDKLEFGDDDSLEVYASFICHVYI